MQSLRSPYLRSLSVVLSVPFVAIFGRLGKFFFCTALG